MGLALLTFITNLNRKVKSRRILNANDYQMLLVNIGFCLEIPNGACDIIAFIEDPDGNRIEIIQSLKPH